MYMLKELFMGKSPMKEEPKKKISLVLKDNAVTTNTIKDKAVTFKKFSDDAVGNIRDMIDSTVNADKNSIANLTYYECATASQDEIKSVETPYYYLTVGGAMRIKMLHSNSYEGTVKLKVGDAEAQPLFYNGATISSSNTWDAGETLVVYFDGNVYQAIGIDSLIEKYISSAEANFHEYVDNVAAAIQQSIDAIVNSDDTEAINTIGEIATFLEGISNTTTLTALLTDINDRITTVDGELNGRISTLASNIVGVNATLQREINQLGDRVTTTQGDIDTTNSNVTDLDDRVGVLEGIIGTEEGEGSIQERMGSLEDQLDTKVDKVEGQSLINADYAEDIIYDESLEYMKVTTDSEGHILWGITTTGDIKYGCGVPTQVKDYVDSQLSAEVERAQAAEQSMIENRIIQVDELPEASKDTVDHIYLVPAEESTDSHTKEIWITVEFPAVIVERLLPRTGGGYEIKKIPYKIIENSESEAVDWYAEEMQTPNDGDIFLNANWAGYSNERIIPSDWEPVAYIYDGNNSEFTEIKTITDGENHGFEYGSVWHIEADSNYFLATSDGWKVYNTHVTPQEISDEIELSTIYQWEKITSNNGTIKADKFVCGEGNNNYIYSRDEDPDFPLVIYSETGVELEANISFGRNHDILDVDTIEAKHFRVNDGSTVGTSSQFLKADGTIDSSSYIKGTITRVYATSATDTYTIDTSVLQDDSRNYILFMHNPADTFNTSHTMNVVLGSNTYPVTFTNTQMKEICVIKKSGVVALMPAVEPVYFINV